MMPWLHVVSLDMTMQLAHFEAGKFLTAADRYGWTMSDVMEMKTI